MLDQQMKMELLKMILTSESSVVKAESFDAIKPLKQIVIAQRGWVFIGMVTKQAENFVIKNASVIRTWGTTKGLGELAKDGPIKDKTILDPCPDVTIHELSIVARINCEF